MSARVGRGVLLIALISALPGVAMANSARAKSNAIYDATCALCHQAGGAGLQGQFPRLAGRVDRMAADTVTREFLIQTLLHGMAGRIEVDGAAITGVMPPFASLPDADLASVLTYVISLGASSAKKVKPVTAAEIAAVRKGPTLSGSQVLEHRAALSAAGRIP